MNAVEAEQQPPPHLPPPDAGLNVEPGSADDGWATPPQVTLSDGTRIQLYKDGEGLAVALAAIRAAQRRICLEIYIFRNDATGRAFADALSERARAGVAVYLIYDSVGSLEATELMDQMKAAGVRIAEFHPLYPWRCRYSWRPWNRDHRKLLVIDDHLGGLGGLNIGDEYAAMWVAGDQARLEGLMRDQAIGIVGPAARSLVRSFATTWHYIQNGGRIRRSFYTFKLALGPPTKGHRPGKPRPESRQRRPTHHALEADFALLASAPTLSSPVRPLLTDLLRGAKHSVTIIMAYFAPDDDLILNLCNAAKRGVRVRLVLPARSDLPVMVVAARSFYTRLLEHGIEIYEREKAVLHAKLLIVDERLVVIGSANLDYRSTELNLEVSAFVDSREFARQATKLFNHDVKFSTRIDAEHWRRRPYYDRFVQWIVSRARYLL